MSPGPVHAGMRKTPAPAKDSKAGLAYWAQRTLDQSAKVTLSTDPEPVHDLRVALRRCRSMAGGFAAVDPDPAWKQLRKLGRSLFAHLGELRDAHVMAEWVKRLSKPADPVRCELLRVLGDREDHLRQTALQAIQKFDRTRWQSLAQKLARRSRRVSPEGLVFQHLALECWEQAYRLHRRALRDRSQIGFHRLRIGLKKFRYVVENFLPRRHQQWGASLKELQDLLGEVHDLDLLWAMVRSNPASLPQDRASWRSRIAGERAQRLQRYRQRMIGPGSLWRVWRAELPQGKHLEMAAFTRLRTWGSFLDPDPAHAALVAQLALQLYDGLARAGLFTASAGTRRVLEAAAWLHDVGRSQSKRGHHKHSYRLIRRLAPPLGWSSRQLAAIAAVARCHRGVLPRSNHKCLTAFPPSSRPGVLRLAGILRLANALDLSHEQPVRLLQVEKSEGAIVIRGQGYRENGPWAERVAAARYLLELCFHAPVLVRSKGRAG